MNAFRFPTFGNGRKLCVNVVMFTRAASSQRSSGTELKSYESSGRLLPCDPTYAASTVRSHASWRSRPTFHRCIRGSGVMDAQPAPIDSGCAGDALASAANGLVVPGTPVSGIPVLREKGCGTPALICEYGTVVVNPGY